MATNFETILHSMKRNSPDNPLIAAGERLADLHKRIADDADPDPKDVRACIISTYVFYQETRPYLTDPEELAHCDEMIQMVNDQKDIDKD